MNTNHEQFERDFEDFLASNDSRLAALYRKLPQAEPDAQLDAAVRAAAQRAAREAPTKHAHRPRWMPSLAAAAVLALTVGVAIHMAPQVWQRPATSNVSEPAAVMQRSKDSVPEQAPAVVAQSPAAPEAAAAPPATTASSPAPKKVPAPAPAPAPAPPPAPPVASAPMLAAPAATPPQPAAPASGASAAKAIPETQADAAQRSKQLMDHAAQRAPAQAFPATEHTAPAPRVHNSKDKQASRSSQLESVVVSDAAAPEPPSSGTPSQSPERGESMRHEPAAAKLSAPTIPENEKPLHLSEPERWLRNIRQLLHEDQREKAVRSLNEFRKRYPDYRLPDDLRDLQ